MIPSCLALDACVHPCIQDLTSLGMGPLWPERTLFPVPQPKKPKTTCPFCAEEINKAATRCRFCCSEIAAAPAAAPVGKELPV